jgi:hypothetical protein
MAYIINVRHIALGQRGFGSRDLQDADRIMQAMEVTLLLAGWKNLPGFPPYVGAVYGRILGYRGDTMEIWIEEVEG